MNTYGRMVEALINTPRSTIEALVRRADESSDDVLKNALYSEAHYLILFNNAQELSMDYIHGDFRKSINLFYCAKSGVGDHLKAINFAEATDLLNNSIAKKMKKK